LELKGNRINANLTMLFHTLFHSHYTEFYLIPRQRISTWSLANTSQTLQFNKGNLTQNNMLICFDRAYTRY